MTEDFKVKWQRCLDIIRDNIGQVRYDAWFACARALKFEGNRLTIGLPSQFFYEKYEDDFYNLLSSALRRVFGEGIKLNYEVGIIANDASARVTLSSPSRSQAVNGRFIQSLQQPEAMAMQRPQPDAGGRGFDPQLNSSLNFENYCVGDSNRLPFTIAEYIANNPHKSDFNPFFLYGDVGVGKTHLIQAIGIRIKERNPNAKVLFTTLRQFQNLYANAVIQKKVPGFINWFQQMDALLFDDLQELSLKTKTGDDALFPVFNHLHQNGKQLIFTCDRPPMALEGIADRLIDRFKWGITEKLEKPDANLRRKILAHKSARNGLHLPEDVISVVADTAINSVRELEGVVMGILTRSITLNAPITVDLAKAVMANSIRNKPETKPLNFEMIVDATAEYYHLNPDVIFSKSRVRDIADARQMIMYLSNKLTGLSSSAIGFKLNRRHATVLHGISAIKDRLPFSKEIAQAAECIEASLRQ